MLELRAHAAWPAAQVTIATAATSNTRTKYYYLFLMTALCFSAVWLSPVHAQDSTTYDSFNDRYRFYVGAFAPSFSSQIAINGDVVSPPPVDVENVLGVDDDNIVAWAGVQWHISQRNSLEFEYFQLNRDGFIDLFPDPVEVADLIIESGSMNTAFDVAVSRITYGFSLMRSERVDLQVKGGLHIADLSIALQLSGAVCDVSLGEMPPCPTGQTPELQSQDVTAPLPHFGISYAYAITPTIAMRLQAIGFAIELDNIDGGLLELDADISWQPWDHLGMGIGVRYFNADVESKGSDLNGKFDLEYYGPVLILAGSF
jgi:hypothetical protein